MTEPELFLNFCERDSEGGGGGVGWWNTLAMSAPMREITWREVHFNMSRKANMPCSIEPEFFLSFCERGLGGGGVGCGVVGKHF